MIERLYCDCFFSEWRTRCWFCKTAAVKRRCMSVVSYQQLSWGLWITHLRKPFTHSSCRLSVRNITAATMLQLFTLLSSQGTISQRDSSFRQAPWIKRQETVVRVYLGMLRNVELILQTTNVHEDLWHGYWSSG